MGVPKDQPVNFAFRSVDCCTLKKKRVVGFADLCGFAGAAGQD